MIEIVKNIIDLCNIYINKIFNINIDLAPGFNVSLGMLIISFLAMILTIYFVLRGFGVISKGDDD